MILANFPAYTGFSESDLNNDTDKKKEDVEMSRISSILKYSIDKMLLYEQGSRVVNIMAMKSVTWV